MTRKTDPIKRVELADGRTRYRFVIDVGRKPDGKRDQRTFTYDTAKLARAERARIIAETAAGTYVRPNRSLTVADYLSEWLDAKATSRKPTTARFYADALRPVIDRHGRLPLQALDVPHLAALRRDMLSGALRRRGRAGAPLSPRAVNATLGAVSTALRSAVKRGLVARNVAEFVDRVPADDAAGDDRGAWQAADAVTFLRSTRGDRLHAAYLLSLLGLRRGEVLGLRWADVDLTGEQAKARRLPDGTPSIAIVNTRLTVAGTIVEGSPKGRGRRRVAYLPMPRVATDALRSARAAQAAERLAAGAAYGACAQCGGGHVVVDELGAPYRPETYSDRFTAAAARAGVPRVPLHGARHAAASLLADLGVPDVAVAAWLGHTQVTVTHGYQHAMVERLAEAGRALGDALTG
jgi:integrase